MVFQGDERKLHTTWRRSIPRFVFNLGFVNPRSVHYGLKWLAESEHRTLHLHEDLKEAGKLCEFDESLGNAMFVSHQWVAHHHPDPKMEQLAVLQQALQNLLAGRSHVHLPPTLEMFFGRLKCPSAADFTAKPLFLWYDYFSCPQSTCANATSNRQLAIDCIPSYVARCYFFVILCPFVESAPGQTLNYSTWEARGWCRLEYMARCLAREDGGIITIKSPHHQMLGANLNGVLKAHSAGSSASVSGAEDGVWSRPT